MTDVSSNLLASDEGKELTFDENNCEDIPKPQWHSLSMCKGQKDNVKLLFSVVVAELDYYFQTPVDKVQLDVNDIEDDESDWDESDEEEDGMNVKTTVKGKVDGLEKFVECLPFASTEVSVFLETVVGLQNSHGDLTLELLKENLPKESQWSERVF